MHFIFILRSREQPRQSLLIFPQTIEGGNGTFGDPPDRRVGYIMKRQYEKPMLAVEHYSLTQSITACSGIKIYSSAAVPGRDDVKKDPDATNAMLNWVRVNGFLEGGANCSITLNGYTDTDGVCYHTNLNAAFNS